jgi:hypothetical protein
VLLEVHVGRSSKESGDGSEKETDDSGDSDEVSDESVSNRVAKWCEVLRSIEKAAEGTTEAGPGVLGSPTTSGKIVVDAWSRRMEGEDTQYRQ